MEKCKFCNSEPEEINIEVRTTLAEDNICEIKDCKDCDGCVTSNQHFSMQLVGGNTLQLSYRHKLGELIISPISERRAIKYCPECGRKL